MGRVVEPSDPNLHLLERILSTENVRIAWERVKSNKGAPGLDNVSIDEFPELFRPKWKEIRESILAGTSDFLRWVCSDRGLRKFPRKMKKALFEENLKEMWQNP